MKVLETVETLIHHYEEEIESRTPGSRDLYEHACQYLAGGVSGDGKSWQPFYISEATGCRLVDIDGNSYIDLVMGYGPNLLGHSPDAVVNALTASLSNGMSVALPTESEVKLAEKISQLVPSMELCRFVTSGTEATMMALRVARAFTGRSKIAKFEGHYHGQHDGVLLSALGPVAGSPSRPVAYSDSAGLAPGVTEDVLILPWNDIDAVLEVIKDRGRELAAVICEPIPHLVLEPADAGFLEELAAATADQGILLIFDEVVTGFRIGLGGAAAHLGVQPDLHTFGKVVGGGLPIGVYGGRRDVMEAVLGPSAEVGKKIFQSGTYSGTPAVMVAGLAALTEIERTAADKVATERAEAIRAGWRQICRDLQLEAQVVGLASWFGIFFTSRTIRTRRDVLLSDGRLARAFALGLLARGFFFIESHPGFTSSAHRAEDVESVLQASAQVLGEISRVQG